MAHSGNSTYVAPACRVPPIRGIPHQATEEDETKCVFCARTYGARVVPSAFSINIAATQRNYGDTMSSADQTTESIRSVLGEHARLGAPITDLTEDGNLYDAGMTSHASVEVMLALESEFDVEFPDRMLRREVFESIAAIRDAILELQEE